MWAAAALAFAREGASVVRCDVNVAAAEATVEMVRAQDTNFDALPMVKQFQLADQALGQGGPGLHYKEMSMSPTLAGDLLITYA